MKKFSMAIVLIVALALVGTAAYAAMAYDSGDAESEKEEPQPDQTDPVKTIIAPADTDNRSITLSVKYPGQGVGGYTYETDRIYTFEITGSSNNWTGKTNIMMFAERSDGGIDTGCVHASVEGSDVTLAKNYVEPENILSATIRTADFDSDESIQIPLDISFSRIGDFTLIFQAFDEKGNPISAPLRCYNLHVPVSGNISLGVNETLTENDETIVKTEVTNDTNVRVTINAADFYLISDTRTFRANDQSEPESRTLNFRGDSSGNDKMEILLHFEYTGSLDGYSIEYRGAYAAGGVDLN